MDAGTSPSEGTFGSAPSSTSPSPVSVSESEQSISGGIVGELSGGSLRLLPVVIFSAGPDEDCSG